MSHVQCAHTHVHVDTQMEAIIAWTFMWTPSRQSYRLPAAAPSPLAPPPVPPATLHTPPLSAVPAPLASTHTHNPCPCQQQLAQSAQHGPAGNDCPWRRRGRAGAAARGSPQRACPAAGPGRRVWVPASSLRRHARGPREIHSHTHRPHVLCPRCRGRHVR